MSTHDSASPFVYVPSPWQCKGEAFWFPGYINPKKGEHLQPVAFSDPERASRSPDTKATGDYHGGLTSLMLVRYKETPVGMYPYVSLHHIPINLVAI